MEWRAQIGSEPGDAFLLEGIAHSPESMPPRLYILAFNQSNNLEIIYFKSK